MMALLGLRQPEFLGEAGLPILRCERPFRRRRPPSSPEGRSQVALGEAPAVLMGHQRMVEISRLRQVDSRCNKRWVGVGGADLPRTTKFTPQAASSTTQARW